MTVGNAANFRENMLTILRNYLIISRTRTRVLLNDTARFYSFEKALAGTLIVIGIAKL